MHTSNCLTLLNDTALPQPPGTPRQPEPAGRAREALHRGPLWVLPLQSPARAPRGRCKVPGPHTTGLAACPPLLPEVLLGGRPQQTQHVSQGGTTLWPAPRQCSRGAPGTQGAGLSPEQAPGSTGGTHGSPTRRRGCRVPSRGFVVYDVLSVRRHLWGFVAAIFNTVRPKKCGFNPRK